MKGRWIATEDLKTGRMHQVSDFGIIRTEEVWSDRGHWRRDISGGVHPIDSDFARQLAATDAWMARRDYLKPGHGGATFGPVEQHDEAGRHFDVVTAAPPVARRSRSGSMMAHICWHEPGEPCRPMPRQSPMTTTE